MDKELQEMKFILYHIYEEDVVENNITYHFQKIYNTKELEEN